jgi:hypothetical protein
VWLGLYGLSKFKPGCYLFSMVLGWFFQEFGKIGLDGGGNDAATFVRP